jgi:3-hydroxyacyl-CoA dehydrogenase/enoyl-CoA hydratase/3-hydroxybutyryl-CoA epimerase
VPPAILEHEIEVRVMPEVTYHLNTDTNIASLVIDTAGPLNTIGRQFVTDLERAVEQASQDGPRGVLLLSAKRRSFLDGANIKEILAGETPQLVRLAVLRYQDVLASLAKTEFPVVAVLDGSNSPGWWVRTPALGMRPRGGDPKVQDGTA